MLTLVYCTRSVLSIRTSQYYLSFLPWRSIEILEHYVLKDTVHTVEALQGIRKTAIAEQDSVFVKEKYVFVGTCGRSCLQMHAVTMLDSSFPASTGSVSYGIGDT